MATCRLPLSHAQGLGGAGATTEVGGGERWEVERLLQPWLWLSGE